MHDLRTTITRIIALGEQGPVGTQVAFVQDTACASIRCSAWARAQIECRPQAGIKVMVAKRLLECSKSRFAGTVTGSDVVHFVCVMQCCGNLFDGLILGRYQMKPARDEVDMWVDLGGFGND